MDPDTPHRDEWLVERSRYIFRAYDTNADRLLDFAEFSHLIADLLNERSVKPETLSKCCTIGIFRFNELNFRVEDDRVGIEAQRLFSCQDAFTEDAFIFTIGPKLSPLFRLRKDHPLLQSRTQFAP